jgi:hypothetical protein
MDCFSDSRSLVSKLRRLEKETHLLQRALADDPLNEEIMIEMDDLERQVSGQFGGGITRIHFLSSLFPCPMQGSLVGAKEQMPGLGCGSSSFLMPLI